MSNVDIRPAADDDLPALIDALGQPYFFAERLRLQREGRGVLLVAWRGGKPVGDVYLWLDPADEPEVRKHLPGVPLLNHLEVHESQHRRGVGTALVRAAERLLRARGQDRVALGVREDNFAAMRLYRRLGFREWPHPPVLTARVEYSSTGIAKFHPETCYMFVKEL